MIKLIHPSHNKPMTLQELDEYHDKGVYNLISKKDRGRLDYFLTCFEQYRKEKNERIIDISLYNDLPFSIKNRSWKSKRKDIKIINKIIGKKKQLSILDIGSWNGWLSNYLSSKGHYVVSTDIFSDEFDGLKAKNHYMNDFLAIQLMPDEVWRIQHGFDLIIFNRNWPYIENQKPVFEHAKSLLNNEGTILFTGLTFYKKPFAFETKLDIEKLSFEKKYKISLLFFNTKGYLNIQDYYLLKKMGVTLESYDKIRGVLNKISKNTFYKYGFFSIQK